VDDSHVEGPALAVVGEDGSVCLATVEVVVGCRNWAIDAVLVEVQCGIAVAVDEVVPCSERACSEVAFDPHREPVPSPTEAQRLSLWLVMKHLALLVLPGPCLPRVTQPLRPVPAFQAPQSRSASGSTRPHRAGSL
jgi:hypothetical protein